MSLTSNVRGTPLTLIMIWLGVIEVIEPRVGVPLAPNT